MPLPIISHSMFLRFTFFGFIIVFGAFLPAQELTDKQRSLSGRYTQLEQILLRLSETSANSNPRQATLLKKALYESKDKLIVQRFETLVNALERRQLSDAVNGQADIERDMLLLLKLLESENRNEQREKEKEQIKEFIRNLEEILHNERVLKNQTRQQESQNLPTLEKKQRDIRIQAQTLRDRLAEHEGVSPPSESESGESVEQSEGKPATAPPEPPTQRALRGALKRMRQAEQKLQQAEKEGTLEEQEEAIAELQRLKEELEKILRQLREEELMQTLEKLEARFKRMLQQEQTIRSQTEKLLAEGERKSATEQRSPEQRQIKIRADQLAGEQQSVIEDAEVVLILLREDGTAQAIVESLLQARFDMTEVKSRLGQTVIDTGTIRIEDAVIDALQEMLEAVQSAMEESQQRQENQQPPQDGEMEEEPLIQLLAELRMIRSMQRRVNERTKRYNDEIQKMLEMPDTDLNPLRSAVEELTRQQNRISRILHELKMGKTQ